LDRGGCGPPGLGVVACHLVYRLLNPLEGRRLRLPYVPGGVDEKRCWRAGCPGVASDAPPRRGFGGQGPGGETLAPSVCSRWGRRKTMLAYGSGGVASDAPPRRVRRPRPWRGGACAFRVFPRWGRRKRCWRTGAGASPATPLQGVFGSQGPGGEALAPPVCSRWGRRKRCWRAGAGGVASDAPPRRGFGGQGPGGEALAPSVCSRARARRRARRVRRSLGEGRARLIREAKLFSEIRAGKQDFDRLQCKYGPRKQHRRLVAAGSLTNPPETHAISNAMFPPTPAPLVPPTRTLKKQFPTSASSHK
jgi:hypothetical protein